MSAGAAVLVAVLAAALRLLPSLRSPQIGADAGYHLLVRRETRRHRRMPRRIAALALDERQTYPALFHLMLAALPLSWLRRVPALPSTILDILLALLAGVVAAETAPLAGADPQRAALIAGVLVAASPALLAPGIGPRAYEITPRPLGELLFAAGAAAAGQFHASSEPTLAVVSASSFALALLSSKFTAQVIVFVLPVMAAAVGDWRILALAAAAFPLAGLFSGGSYWWVLTGQIAHLKLYGDRLQKDHPALEQRRKGDLLAALRRALAAGLSDRGANRAAAIAFDASPVVQFAFRHLTQSLAPLVAIAAAIGGERMTASSWSVWLHAWLLAPVVPFLVTAQPRFLFLGEAERYLEYAVVPAAVLTATVAAIAPVWLGIVCLLVWLGAGAAAVGYVWLRLRHLGERAGLAPLVEHLGTYPQGQRILPIPSVPLAFELAWRCEHRFLAAMDTLVWARAYDRLFVKYPWPSSDLDWWRTTHHATLVVVAKAWLEPARGCDWRYGLDRLDRRFDSTEFAVYQFPSGPECPSAQAAAEPPPGLGSVAGAG